MNHTRLLLFVLSLLSGPVALSQEASARRPGGTNATFAVREFRASNGHSLPFSLFVPKSDPQNPASMVPLVLCLHGSGGNTAAANVLATAEMQQKYPCVVMAPACDGRSSRWVEAPVGRGRDARAVTPELIEAIDFIVQEANVDRTRIYVTGQSMGGVGTWGLLAKHADRFAAAIPVCGVWSVDDATKMDGVAIWAFHGDMDQTVPVAGSRDMIAALKKAGVRPEPRYTELAGVGHASWVPAYASADLWQWLFLQRREKPE
jgi:predicted peptidase